jgi:glycosyltransferase involved in cell wall biosynthesis
LKIALLGFGFEWAGGAEFLRHIANGLLAKKNTRQIKIYLLLPAAGKNESMLDYFKHTLEDDIEIVYHEPSHAGLVGCLNQIKADIALPSMGGLGRGSPWLGYIWDFQHKYLHGNFEPSECFDREIQVSGILRDSRAIIVNSRAVKDDVLRFYPWVKAETIFNLPFAPHPLAEWFEETVIDIGSKYKLPAKYFLISNQFWIHKGHLVAFKALNRIAAMSDVSIVCTGNMNDYRRPEYLDELKQFVGENGLSRRVQLLGHIPKRDQIELMKGALAVVQPTNFEGGPGGGCVYDAVSLGVPVILSDIPVNKEVVSENLWFFQADNDEDLAEKMIVVLGTHIIRPDKDRLIRMGQENLSRLGDRLFEAIDYVKAN